MENTIFTVSELTRRIKVVLEGGFNNVSVRGEISNFKHHSSGHLYFTLKDESSQLGAVMWRGRAAGLFFTPQDGMKVIARGNITVYEVRGIYQIEVVHLQPLGVGELQLAFERLKQKLDAEGLFAPEHKRPLPKYPERIALVTSSTGAAIRDIVNVIARRFPAVELFLYPVRVQGSGAAEEIASAIAEINLYGGFDVMIVGRGGGSIEDLWAFNEEIVARAIYGSRIPIVSAVGHEIDFTIADFVADYRAPTPSAAAEIVVPDAAEFVENVRNFCYTGGQLVSERLRNERLKLSALVSSYSFNRPHDLLRQYAQRCDELRRSADRSISYRAVIARQNLESLQRRIESVDPDRILQRGYAMVMKDGRIVGKAAELAADDPLRVKFHDGTVRAKVL